MRHKPCQEIFGQLAHNVRAVLLSSELCFLVRIGRIVVLAISSTMVAQECVAEGDDSNGKSEVD